MNGGLGADVLIGSEGDDLVNGGDGNDTALMGAGDDTFVWNPGDDNDTLEGQAGFDTMLFNGANIAENIDISANGGRVRFIRDVANVTMDLNDVEGIDFNALGGADTIVGQRPQRHRRDRGQPQPGGRSAARGRRRGRHRHRQRHQRRRRDAVVAGDASGVAVLGLAAQVNITGAEAANDRLTVNALAGDDVVEASRPGRRRDPAHGRRRRRRRRPRSAATATTTLLGGAGDDVLIGGPGIDILDGGAGDNIVIQLVGEDTLTSAAVGREGMARGPRSRRRRQDRARGRRQEAHASPRGPDPARSGRLSSESPTHACQRQNRLAGSGAGAHAPRWNRLLAFALVAPGRIHSETAFAPRRRRPGPRLL